MWGIKDTSVTFCEEPYKESKYIAEYYNTLTGLGYLLVSLPFLRTKVKNLAIIGIFLGIGTILLHMTQRIYGQILDELSMLMLSYGILTKMNNIYVPKYGILLIIAYLCFYDKFIVFLTMFISIMLCIVKETQKFKSKRYLVILVMSFGMVCWILDQIACKYVKKYYLHALWHICTSISILIGFYCINDLIQDSSSKISHSGKSQ
jgi:hypothetical protein